MLDKRPEMLQAYYSENIRLMPEFQKTVMGKSNAMTYYKAFSGRFEIHDYSRDELETIDLGSRVVELGMFSMRMKFRSTGNEHELKGKYSTIWEKATDGKLSLITEAWNYNHQVPIAEHLIFEEVPTVNIALQAHLPVNSSISFELAAYNRLQEVVITQHDPKMWSQFYTDDYMLFYSNNPIYKGRKEVDAFLEEHVKHLPVFEKLDIRNDHIDALGDYVIEYASHIAIIRNGDWSGVSTGKNIRIWRREKDGSLKIFRGIGMYD
jgi:ketosteroid isomerase-like protein